MKAFAQKVIQWYEKNKRALPWRQNTTPYKTWLSEIILQQTRVDQGLTYYTNIINKYKTLNELAAEEEAELLKLWQGLGYYTRARNLHATARYLAEHKGGAFPQTYAELIKLRGVGRYTAAAIASICFGEAIPVIDGNVYRVIARCFSIDMPVPSTQAHNYFSALLTELIDEKNPGDFNQGVMELGALICTPQKPDCGRCPLQRECSALRDHKTALYPLKLRKKKSRDRYFDFLVATHDRQWLLLQRGRGDIWAKLYTFPLIEGQAHPTIAQLEARLQVERIQLLSQTVHKLTHQNLHIRFWLVNANRCTYKRLMTAFAAFSVTEERIERYAVPKPIENFLRILPSSHPAFS